MKAEVINVYDLPPVSNICDQILRECVRLPKVSMAHVIMQPKNSSLLHEHHGTEECYFITRGKGILYNGAEVLQVGKGSFVSVPVYTPHQLKNFEKSLEHLVLAFPPFNPDDVFVIDTLVEKRHMRTVSLPIPIRAADGAIVYELDVPTREKSGFGCAYGMLPPKQTANIHFHEQSDEVYYVVSGNGKVRLDNHLYSLVAGSLVMVPAGVRHGLQNTSARKHLEIFCLSSPPYTDSDFLRG
ncbi:MAG: hypothetical protein RL557_521 [archaeon]|jgi:mannose-6-phosphate isomerase-like protein (cupin superfamily)